MIEVYWRIIKLIRMYGSESRRITKSSETKVQVMKLKHRRIKGVARMSKLRNEKIRKELRNMGNDISSKEETRETIENMG